MKKSMYSPKQEVLQELLKRVRVEAGLKQRELANLLDTPQTRISDYEIGERRIDVVQLEGYLQPLGITLSEFVRRYEELCASLPPV